MIKLHEQAAEFLNWFDENYLSLRKEDRETLRSAVYILRNSSSFEWYWLWANLRSILIKVFPDE